VTKKKEKEHAMFKWPGVVVWYSENQIPLPHHHHHGISEMGLDIS
jgi:hypothetical protein